jgi:hypothetical protein
MRHLVYAVKVLVNEDLKAQDRRKTRRAQRRRAPKAATQLVTTEPAIRPTPSAEPATRSAEVARPRRAANAGA